MTEPVSIAMGQGGSCWGCYQSLVDIHLGLADILPRLDIKFWQAVADFKLHHLESYPEKSIVVGLYEGMIRTEEDIHLLKVMREKCKILIAFGSCACFGGIAGMANFSTIDECYDVKFRNNRTFSGGKVPSVNLPLTTPVVKPNNAYVDFEIYLPGCPPTSKIIATAVTALLDGKPIDLPPHTVCHYCPKEKKETPVERFKRSYEGVPDQNWCLLEQGYLCLGPSTWGVCEAQCPKAGAVCQGCHGPPGHFEDQGAAAISMLGSYGPLPPDEILDQIKDPLGLLWRFTYGTSHLGQIRIRREEKK